MEENSDSNITPWEVRADPEKSHNFNRLKTILNLDRSKPEATDKVYPF